MLIVVHAVRIRELEGDAESTFYTFMTKSIQDSTAGFQSLRVQFSFA